MLFGMLDPRFALKKVGGIFVLALSLKPGLGGAPLEWGALGRARRVQEAAAAAAPK